MQTTATTSDPQASGGALLRMATPTMLEAALAPNPTWAPARLPEYVPVRGGAMYVPVRGSATSRRRKGAEGEGT